MAEWIGGALVVMFILISFSQIVKTWQVVTLMQVGAGSQLGFVSFLLIATNIVRVIIAALFFLRIKWFYWLLVLSMAIVYVFPAPPYPTSLANTPMLIMLVVFIGAVFAAGRLEYVMVSKKPRLMSSDN